MTGIIWQAVSLLGAALVLVAYAINTRGRWYYVLNVTGTKLLLAAAIYRGDVGFVMLNVSWLAVTIYQIWRSRHTSDAKVRVPQPELCMFFSNLFRASDRYRITYE